MVPPPAARVPVVAPDAGFVNMLRYGMLALRLLPESSCKSEFKIKLFLDDFHYFNSTVLTMDGEYSISFFSRSGLENIQIKSLNSFFGLSTVIE
jgi:hypothetical protein